MKILILFLTLANICACSGLAVVPSLRSPEKTLKSFPSINLSPGFGVVHMIFGEDYPLLLGGLRGAFRKYDNEIDVGNIFSNSENNMEKRRIRFNKKRLRFNKRSHRFEQTDSLF